MFRQSLKPRISMVCWSRWTTHGPPAFFSMPLVTEWTFRVQAVTKYIGGHSDLLLGAVTIREKALYERLGTNLALLGMVASPDDCSLALRGLQTLHVRLKAIEESALRVASWLADRHDVEAVLHPALPSCLGH